MSRQKLSGAELRERLIAAAIVQVREHGRAGFSLRETARSAGVDPAMVYRQFADKDALVESVALRAFAGLAEASREASAAAGDGSRDQLLALGRTYVRFARERPTEFDLMFPGGRRPAIPTDAPSAYDQLTDLLGRAGDLPLPPDAAALLCWSTVHGAAALAASGALAGYLPEAVDPLDLVLVSLVDLIFPAARI